MIEIKQTPEGFFVLSGEAPIHGDPISEKVARWLADDLMETPQITRCKFDLGTLYEAAVEIRTLMMEGAPIAENALSVAMNALQGKTEFEAQVKRLMDEEN